MHEVGLKNLGYAIFEKLYHELGMLSQGVDLITAYHRAGHANSSTTANIYAHALKKPDENTTDKLESLLNTPKDPPKTLDKSGHLLDTYVSKNELIIPSMKKDRTLKAPDNNMLEQDAIS